MPSQPADNSTASTLLRSEAAAYQQNVAFFLAALYAVFAVAHKIMLPPQTARPMIIMALGTAAASLAIAVLARVGMVHLAWAHSVNALLAGLILLNSATHLSITGHLFETTNFMLLVLAIGSIFYSWRWFWAMIFISCASWIGITSGVAGTEEWWHFAFALVVSCCLAALYHLLRVRSELELLELREAEQKERRNAEIALEILGHSRDELSNFFQDSSDLIVNSDQSGHLYYVNRKWKEVLGYSDEDVPRLSAFSLIAPAQRDLWKSATARAFRGEEVPYIECELIAKDGHRIWVEGRPQLHLHEGFAMGTRAIFRDITRRKEAQTKAGSM